MKMKMKSVVATLGCSECAYFSALRNCIKVGLSTKEINEGRAVTTVTNGTFHLDEISYCPMKDTKVEMLERKRIQALMPKPKVKRRVNV